MLNGDLHFAIDIGHIVLILILSCANNQIYFEERSGSKNRGFTVLLYKALRVNLN